MAEYPWGSMLPAKRIATIDNQIAVNDKKRADLIEAHKTKIAELDENERKLKADLRQATSIQEKPAAERITSSGSETPPNWRAIWPRGPGMMAADFGIAKPFL